MLLLFDANNKVLQWNKNKNHETPKMASKPNEDDDASAFADIHHYYIVFSFLFMSFVVFIVIWFILRQ